MFNNCEMDEYYNSKALYLENNMNLASRNGHQKGTIVNDGRRVTGKLVGS
jgi:hypothetical protein